MKMMIQNDGYKCASTAVNISITLGHQEENEWEHKVMTLNSMYAKET